MPTIGRIGDKRAQRENFGTQSLWRSAKVCARRPWLLGFCARQTQRRMVVSEALAEGEELSSNTLPVDRRARGFSGVKARSAERSTSGIAGGSRSAPSIVWEGRVI